jgi:hypothetical protein
LKEGEVVLARKFGAPPKRSPKPGERFQVGIRVTPEVKNRLDEAAARTGRSQSQEAEFRLEHSFDRENVLVDALTMAFGNRKTTALLLLVGLALERGAHDALVMLERITARPSTAEHWTSNAIAFDAALEAAYTVLEAARPGDFKLLHNVGTGVGAARSVLSFFGALSEAPADRDPSGEVRRPEWMSEQSARAVADVATHMPVMTAADLRMRLANLLRRFLQPIDDFAETVGRADKDRVSSRIAVRTKPLHKSTGDIIPYEATAENIVDMIAAPYADVSTDMQADLMAAISRKFLERARVAAQRAEGKKSKPNNAASALQCCSWCDLSLAPGQAEAIIARVGAKMRESNVSDLTGIVLPRLDATVCSLCEQPIPPDKVNEIMDRAEHMLASMRKHEPQGEGAILDFQGERAKRLKGYGS